MLSLIQMCAEGFTAANTVSLRDDCSVASKDSNSEGSEASFGNVYSSEIVVVSCHSFDGSNTVPKCGVKWVPVPSAVHDVSDKEIYRHW